MRTRLSLLSELLRISLATIVFLAAVAGARMQGDMGALALSGGAHLVLCLTDPSAPTPDSDTAHKSHCVLCSLPFADAVPATASPAERTSYVAVLPLVLQETAPSSRSIFNPARGPPVLG